MGSFFDKGKSIKSLERSFCRFRERRQLFIIKQSKCRYIFLIYLFATRLLGVERWKFQHEFVELRGRVTVWRETAILYTEWDRCELIQWKVESGKSSSTIDRWALAEIKTNLTFLDWLNVNIRIQLTLCELAAGYKNILHARLGRSLG